VVVGGYCLHIVVSLQDVLVTGSLTQTAGNMGKGIIGPVLLTGCMPRERSSPRLAILLFSKLADDAGVQIFAPAQDRWCGFVWANDVPGRDAIMFGVHTERTC
jgi:hypothetical protein